MKDKSQKLIVNLILEAIEKTDSQTDKDALMTARNALDLSIKRERMFNGGLV